MHVHIDGCVRLREIHCGHGAVDLQHTTHLTGGSSRIGCIRTNMLWRAFKEKQHRLHTPQLCAAVIQLEPIRFACRPHRLIELACSQSIRHACQNIMSGDVTSSQVWRRPHCLQTNGEAAVSGVQRQRAHTPKWAMTDHHVVIRLNFRRVSRVEPGCGRLGQISERRARQRNEARVSSILRVMIPG